MALVIAPPAAGAFAWLLGGRAPASTERLGVFVCATGFLVAAMLGVVAAGTTPASAGSAVVSMVADQLATALLLLIFGVSTVAQEFAVRYLAGDARAPRFSFGAGLLTGSTALMVTASTTVALAAGWTAAGIAMCFLLGLYWELPIARDGLRRTVIAFTIGDGALWAAVAVLAIRTGTIDLSRLSAIGGSTGTLAAVLVVVAALSRSAQIPFHRWLPATLAAPTPVSALLHAGVVNAGGLLLVRMSPLVSAPPTAILIVVAGTASMAYGAVIMTIKPDIKGALTYSTMAQMGFMIVTCGLGLWAAAIIHLIAHGFYKATLFLSSGSAIARRQRDRAMPDAKQLTGRTRAAALAAAAGLPVAALSAAVLLVPVWPNDHGAELALLLFAWMTGAIATWGWLEHRPTPSGALSAAAFLLPAAIAYVTVVSAVSAFLRPALPDTTTSAPMAWAIVAAALVMLVAAAILRVLPRSQRIQRAIYTHALSASTIHPQPAGASR